MRQRPEAELELLLNYGQALEAIQGLKAIIAEVSDLEEPPADFPASADESEDLASLRPRFCSGPISESPTASCTVTMLPLSVL